VIAGGFPKLGEFKGGEFKGEILNASGTKNGSAPSITLRGRWLTP
jgi:hypothetical protein